MPGPLKPKDMSQYDAGFRAATRQAASFIKKFADNYPESVWPGPAPGESLNSDRAAAHMARHICSVIYRNVIEQTPEETK